MPDVFRLVPFSKIIFLILILIIERAAVLYLTEPVDYSIYFHHTLKNKAEKNNGQIDMVILGDSLPQRTFDPAIFEQIPGISSVYNAASGLQPLQASYYLLEELIDRYQPKYAILGITWERLQDANSTLAKVIVLDRLTGKYKIEFLSKGFSPDEYLNAVSLCYRFRNNLTMEKIKENLKEKKELRENGYTQRWSPPDLYTDSGFVYSYQGGNIPNYENISYDPQMNDPQKVEMLENIVRLCEQNGVRLFLVSAPTTMMTLYRTKNYQDSADFLADFAVVHGVDYVNLNYLRDREEWLGDELMFDFNHVNGEGAERVSQKYADYLKTVISDEEVPADLFYADLAELQSEVHRIIAVGADISVVDLKATIHVTSRQTDNITPLYRIQISHDDNTYTPLTDWSGQTDYVFDVSSYHGTVHFLIEAMSPAGEPGCTIRYHEPI